MTERLLYYDRSMDRVRAVSLDAFAARFGTDPAAWAALHRALFELDRVVRFLGRDGITGWIAPYDANSDGAMAQGWTFGAFVHEPEPLPAPPGRALAVLPSSQGGARHAWRLVFECRPRLTASAIVEARSEADAADFARRHFHRLREELWEAATTSYEGWEPAAAEFRLDAVEPLA